MTDLIDVALDFETYYDTEYSLTKMTNMEYVLDPRFEVIGMSLKVGNGETKWYTGDYEYLKSVLATIPWARARLIAFNAMFDASILEWFFGFNPHTIFCAMVGSRPYVVPYTGSMSLAAVAKHLGVGEKGHEVDNHRGRHREDFTAPQLASYGNYCCNDSELTVKVAACLFAWLSEDEKLLIDLTMKKYLRPSFVLDIDAVGEAQEELSARYATLLAKLGEEGLNDDMIRSRTKFTALLKARGVDPPTKKSKTTGKDTYAFAKDDEDFIELLTHADPVVRMLVDARRTLSSTQETSRLERFRTIWNLDLGGEHLLPVPLLYYAAHPGRFGGAEKINLQNLPRPSAKNPRLGALRRAMRAPDGYSVLTADFSNIEARIIATLAGQWDLVAAFSNGVDVYSEFATRIYGRQITKANKDERFVGKTCILGLGYGMGWERFLKAMSMAGIKMDAKEAKRIVHLYRETYPSIPLYWKELETQLMQSTSPTAMFKHGPFIFAHERIILPNGMPIIYPNLRQSTDPLRYNARGLVFDSKRRGAKVVTNHLWGGIIAENVTQALARIIAVQAELRIARAGLTAAHQAHDELIWVMLTSWIKKVIPGIEKAMCQSVEWLPNLPIAVEIHHGPTYGDCK